MQGILDGVLQTIRRHSLIPPSARVLVAVSGGSDSVALAHLLHRLSKTEEFKVSGIIHLHHGLRGEAADEDAKATRVLADDLQVPYHETRVDVRAMARERGNSIEEAGRAARLAFFEETAKRVGADRVAVGHHQDDQAETFLLRILRGAGTRGLSSIYPRHGVIIRPLLELSKRALSDFLDAESIKFRNDETNNDLTIPRNRIRHELLPYLRENFTQGISAVLAREAHVARQDADWLDDAADQVSARVVETRENVVTLDARELPVLPPALAWRVVKRALGTFARDRFISLDHVEAVMGLTVSGNKCSVSLPGQRAEMVSGSVHLEPADVVMTTEPVEFSYMLPVPGEVLVEESGRRIKATLGKVPDRSGLCNRSELVAVDAERVAGPMTVRGRRPGDRLRPLGSPGNRSLQDLFVDRKVSRASRDRVPIVTDSDGRIVWIVGLTVAHQFRVTERTQSVIFLESKRLGVEE